jgi:hypothetical protein
MTLRQLIIHGVVQRAQAGALTWQGALAASSGALEPSKASWGLVDFVWINGQW